MRNGLRVVTLGMAISLVSGAMVFANDTMMIDDSLAYNSVVEFSEQNVVDLGQYMSQKGTISSISETEDGYTEIVIDNDMGGLRFILGSSTAVLDMDISGYALAEDLEVGMDISVVYSKTAPMGMSLPGFLSDADAVVIHNEYGKLAVEYFNNELISTDMNLQLLVSEDTNIQSANGSRILLTEEDLKENNLLVVYENETRGIPAQTTPSFVMLLNGGVDTVEEVTVDTGVVLDGTDMDSMEYASDVEKTGGTLVALRETANSKGYSIEWYSNDQPVLIEGTDFVLETKVGSNIYRVNGEEVICTNAAELVDGIMYVDSYVFE